MTPYEPAVTADAPAPWRAPLAWRIREAVTGYLPLLLMALLALGTWWLVANTPVADVERARAAPRHEADYTMQRFVVQRFAPDGSLRVEIEGDELRHYPDNDTIEIDRVRMRSWSREGRLTEASASRALTNGAATEVQLLGGARVVREASGADTGPGGEPVEFRGEFLHVFVDTERLQSHLPVTVIHGSGTLRADSFFYDNLSREVRVQGHVRATFLPAGAAGTAGVQ